MKVIQLRRGMEALAEMLRVWGNQRDSRELSEFSNALAEFDSDSLAALLRRLRAENSSEVRKVRTEAQANPALFSDYAERLRASSSSEEVTRLIATMQADKRLRLADLNYIAQAITGAGHKHRNKAAALSAISQFVMRNVREQGVFASIDRMLGRK